MVNFGSVVSAGRSVMGHRFCIHLMARRCKPSPTCTNLYLPARVGVPGAQARGGGALHVALSDAAHRRSGGADVHGDRRSGSGLPPWPESRRGRGAIYMNLRDFSPGWADLSRNLMSTTCCEWKIPDKSRWLCSDYPPARRRRHVTALE